MTSDRWLEDPVLHELKNHIAIILGFSDLVLSELAEDDPRRVEIVEICKAARAATALLPALSDRLR